MSTPDLHAQLRHGAAGSPIVCIVRVGDGHGDGVAYDFRIVELCSTGITMSPEDLPHGVAQPGPSASGEDRRQCDGPRSKESSDANFSPIVSGSESWILGEVR